jgi:hypothetical protein
MVAAVVVVLVDQVVPMLNLELVDLEVVDLAVQLL